jgi:hypothetical protein
VHLHATGPIPAAEETLEQNLVAVGARAFRINLTRWQSKLDLGFSLIGFATLRGETDADFRQVLQSDATFTDLLAGSGAAYRAWGAGVEFGLLYSYKNWLAVGIAGRNFALEQIRTFSSIPDLLSGAASTSRYNVIPLYLSAGVLFRPPIRSLGRFFSDFIFAVDYHDIFDFLIYPPAATNPLLHIGVGGELKLMEILSLRAGYYQCLPSLGLGLDLTLFTLNFAYFGRERSREPGGYPIYCYTIGLEFKY